MEIKLHNQNEHTIAEIIASECILNTPQDALDLMVSAQEQGAESLVICEEQIAADFF